MNNIIYSGLFSSEETLQTTQAIEIMQMFSKWGLPLKNKIKRNLQPSFYQDQIHFECQTLRDNKQPGRDQSVFYYEMMMKNLARSVLT